jgi:hypothetical protein
MCGNSKESSTVADVAVAKNTQFDDVQSSALACDAENTCESKQLKDVEVSKERDVDIRICKKADEIVDKVGENDTGNAIASEGDMSVISNDNFYELKTNSETSVNADKMFERSGNSDAPDHIPVEENKLYDTESSHSPSALDHDRSKTVTSSKSGELSRSNHCNEITTENESVLSCREVERNIETEDIEGALEDELVDVEVQSDENRPSKVLHSVQMLEDGKSTNVKTKNRDTELNEKSSDLEIQNTETKFNEKSSAIEVHSEKPDLNEKSCDKAETKAEVEMQNHQNDHGISGDVEMQDCFVQRSVGTRNETPDSDRKLAGVDAQDQRELNEVSSDGDGDVRPNGADDQVDNANEDHCYNQSKPSMKPDEADNTHFVRIRVRNSSELKAVPSDSIKANDRAVEDNVLKTSDNNEENDSITVEKEAPVIVGKHALDNRGGNQFRTYLIWGLTNMLLELFAL